MRKTNILLIVLITILMSSFAYAVPKLINYQGQLTDSSGNLLNGTYITKFYLFSEEIGGTSLWSEQQELTVTDGIYNVQLGAVNTLNAHLFDNESLYLEVEIYNAGTGWEILSPRQHITSTAFAINADMLDGKHASEFGDMHSLDAADGTPEDSVYVNNEGNVGIGTTSPDTRLHVSGAGAQRVHIESTSFAGVAFLQTSNGDRSWQLGTASSEPFIIQDLTAGSVRMVITTIGNVGIGTVTPQGRLDVNGSIYQRGSQLHADYVFESEYKLESIEEHSKYMWENKHLKAIPKAKVAEDGKEIIEVGSHQRGIVEELEKAHIYIEQLHKRINKMEELIAKNEALEILVIELSTRIEALESNN